MAFATTRAFLQVLSVVLCYTGLVHLLLVNDLIEQYDSKAETSKPQKACASIKKLNTTTGQLLNELTSSSIAVLHNQAQPNSPEQQHGSVLTTC